MGTFVFFDLNEAHDVISLDDNLVGSAVLNDDLTVVIAVDADQ